MVHGDIKATNILVSDDIHALLCDFGLSKFADEQTTTAYKGAGTERWMAPELYDGDPKTFESDVYAFGITIYQVTRRVHPMYQGMIRRVLGFDGPYPSCPTIQVCCHPRCNWRHSTSLRGFVPHIG
jgi:serine/threonine protein kinase